jgi:hypothetical protein
MGLQCGVLPCLLLPHILFLGEYVDNFKSLTCMH